MLRKIGIAAGLMACLGTATAQTVSGFENIISKPDSSYDGSNLDQGHVSGAAHFWNSFNTQWFSWTGFSFSSMRDTSTAGWLNQYSSSTGDGANGSMSYAVAYSYAGVSFTDSPNGDSIMGVSVNNSTYAYLSMLNGDAIAKKFGGSTGNDTDWFYVEFAGYNGGNPTGSVKHYLADFRFADNSKDYIQKGWEWLDLTSLGRIDELIVSFASSDVDATWGFINTPTYVCLDSLVYKNSGTKFSPFALNDRFSSYEATNNEYDILSNDKDPDGVLSGASVTILNDFTQGSSQIASNDMLKFTPGANAYGYDTLIYDVVDADGLKDTAGVILLINDGPDAQQDMSTFFVGGSDSLRIGVLANDTDERLNNLKLTILMAPSHGAVSVRDDSVSYFSTSMEADTFRYQIEDEFGLVDSALVIIDKQTSSVQQLAGKQASLKVYPNPSSEYISFANENVSGMEYSIYNLSGRLVEKGELSSDVTIDVADLDAGMYTIWLTGDNYSSSTRFIVE